MSTLFDDTRPTIDLVVHAQDYQLDVSAKLAPEGIVIPHGTAWRLKLHQEHPSDQRGPEDLTRIASEAALVKAQLVERLGEG